MTAAQQPQHIPQPAFVHGRYVPVVQAILMEGTDADFEKLRGVPGVVLEKMPWQVAKALVDERSEESLGKLGRHPLDTRRYYHFRQQVCRSAGCLINNNNLRNCKSGRPWSTMCATASMAFPPSATTVLLATRYLTVSQARAAPYRWQAGNASARSTAKAGRVSTKRTRVQRAKGTTSIPTGLSVQPGGWHGALQPVGNVPLGAR